MKNSFVYNLNAASLNIQNISCFNHILLIFCFNKINLTTKEGSFRIFRLHSKVLIKPNKTNNFFTPLKSECTKIQTAVCFDIGSFKICLITLKFRPDHFICPLKIKWHISLLTLHTYFFNEVNTSFPLLLTYSHFYKIRRQ